MDKEGYTTREIQKDLASMDFELSKSQIGRYREGIVNTEVYETRGTLLYDKLHLEESIRDAIFNAVQAKKEIQNKTPVDKQAVDFWNERISNYWARLVCVKKGIVDGINVLETGQNNDKRGHDKNERLHKGTNQSGSKGVNRAFSDFTERTSGTTVTS